MRPIIDLMKSTIFALAATAVFASAPAAAADSFLQFGPVKPGTASGKVREAAARTAGGKVEVLSWSWGASQSGWDGSVKGSTALASGNKPAAADYDGDGRADLAVAVGDVDGDGRADRSVKSPRDAASGLPTGKRTHKPLPVRAQADESGSVTLVGKFPACVVGAAYDDAVLRVAGLTYTLHEVSVTSCAAVPGGTGGGPTLSLSVTYLKRKLN